MCIFRHYRNLVVFRGSKSWNVNGSKKGLPCWILCLNNFPKVIPFPPPIQTIALFPSSDKLSSVPLSLEPVQCCRSGHNFFPDPVLRNGIMAPITNTFFLFSATIIFYMWYFLTLFICWHSKFKMNKNVLQKPYFRQSYKTRKIDLQGSVCGVRIRIRLTQTTGSEWILIRTTAYNLPVTLSFKLLPFLILVSLSLN